MYETGATEANDGIQTQADASEDSGAAGDYPSTSRLTLTLVALVLSMFLVSDSILECFTQNSYDRDRRHWIW
jgi:hypothetical protein